MAREINAAEYEAEVLGSPVPVLLDVYGEHCPPCRQLAPVIEKLASLGATTIANMHGSCWRGSSDTAASMLRELARRVAAPPAD